MAKANQGVDELPGKIRVPIKESSDTLKGRQEALINLLERFASRVEQKLARQDHMIAYMGRQMYDVHAELLPEFEGNEGGAGRFNQSGPAEGTKVDPKAVKLFAEWYLQDPLTGSVIGTPSHADPLAGGSPDPALYSIERSINQPGADLTAGGSGVGSTEDMTIDQEISKACSVAWRTKATKRRESTPAQLESPKADQTKETKEAEEARKIAELEAARKAREGLTPPNVAGHLRLLQNLQRQLVRLDRKMALG
eukprot:349398-Prorocentrum_minimum.AAC.2